jgi:uncharacterized RDD family membrane protein YckC
MRRQDKPDHPADEPLLFDLPLAGPGDLAEDPPLQPRRSARKNGATASAAPELPLPARQGPIPVPVPAALDSAAPASEFAGRGRRFAAGMADLLVHAAFGVTALLGARGLGVRPAVADWPALAVFLLAFSFLYTVLPLAFWGYTLGMAWAGLATRNRDGEPLSFDQTARRWLGGLLTALTLGLPLLVAGSRRSLTDIVSGSATYPADEP